MQSINIQNDNNRDTLLSPIRNNIIEVIIGKVNKDPESKIKKNKEVKAQYNLYNTEKSQFEKSTSNDAEYIKKIVAEILSQTTLIPVETSTLLPVRTFSANKLVEDIDKVLEENNKNEQTKHKLVTKTEKRENSDKERKIIEDYLNQLRNPINNIRNSLINNIQTDLKQGKVTLHNARDKLSNMLNIVKNEPNNWLYAIDSQGIKPIDNEPATDQKQEVFNDLSDHDRAMLCKSNNKIRLIQKEIYKYICPYAESYKTEAMSEEKNNLQVIRQNKGGKIDSSKSVIENDHHSNNNKTVWPYFFEHNNNIKEQKFEMEHNSLDIILPSNGYEPIIQDTLMHERKTEQEKNDRGKPKLLYNEPNNREQAAFMEIEANKDYTFQKSLYPLEFAGNYNIGDDYKTERAFNSQRAKEFDPRVENKQDNPIFIRPHAGERNPNHSYPSYNGNTKNTWPYSFDDTRITQNPNVVDRNTLYRIHDGEMLLNNQDNILLKKESLVNDRLQSTLGERERESKLLGTNKGDSKFFNWYETKGNDMIDSKSTGTLSYTAKERPKSMFLDDTTNAKNNISPNNYETMNWPYLIERQKNRFGHIGTEDAKKEPLHTNDNQMPKYLSYEYALPQKDEVYNKLLMDTEARSNFHQQNFVTEKSKNDFNETVKSLPLDVLKEIANTVKQIVLKDLKSEKPIPSTTTASTTTTTATPITTTAITTTITSSTTTNILVPITVISATESKTITGKLSYNIEYFKKYYKDPFFPWIS